VQFIRGLINVPKHLNDTALAIGNFDGIHLGHQSIIHRLISEAKHYDLTSMLMCFEPQTSEYFIRHGFKGRIFRLRDKLDTLRNFDIDYVICLAFTPSLAPLTAERFTQDIIVNKLHCRRLIMGNDFTVGYQRKGDLNCLTHLGQQHGFEVISEKTYRVDGMRDSSTRIREALHQGEFQLVRQLMGRPYRLCGKVRRGDGRGKHLGYPTANIPLSHYKMAAQGIFVVNVTLENGQRHHGVANLGTCPTFQKSQFVLEVYLLDVDEDLYGQMLEVEFLDKLRNELYFDSANALTVQMDKDITKARDYLASNML
jgi:riboflavin kinase/FMN adenylyltransferase